MAVAKRFAGCFTPTAGAERRSALQGAILALVMPTHKRHFAPGQLQFLTGSTYRRAKLFESDRFRLISVLSVGRRAALCASLRNSHYDWYRERGQVRFEDFWEHHSNMIHCEPTHSLFCRTPMWTCVRNDLLPDLHLRSAKD
jgi:hypothetical protein